MLVYFKTLHDTNIFVHTFVSFVSIISWCTCVTLGSLSTLGTIVSWFTLVSRKTILSWLTRTSRGTWGTVISWFSFSPFSSFGSLARGSIASIISLFHNYISVLFRNILEPFSKPSSSETVLV